MTDPNRLDAINGPGAADRLAQLRDEQRAMREKLDAEKQRLLGERATQNGGIVLPEESRQVVEQAKVNTGQVPVVKA